MVHNSRTPTISPCISVCLLDPDSGYCRGCKRTLDEIAAWVSLSEAERARIMGELPARRLTPSET